MKVAIVGCGLIGRRRAFAVFNTQKDEVKLVIDIDMQRAKLLSEEIGCEYSDDWKKVLLREDIESVIVSTPNKYLMPISISALKAGKNVLCEKPPGRNLTETQIMADIAMQTNKILKIGFNHRYHPAIWEAYQTVCMRKEIGEIKFLRAIYGHGGRLNYDQEWRGNLELAGGGELLDQGVHIIDLFHWFVGSFSTVIGITATFNKNLQLEDNAFVLLETLDGKIAQFHTSWTQWRNRFSFEIFGNDGFVRIEGLGKSYGVETLTIGYRRLEGGVPDENKIEYPEIDISWQKEWDEFRNAIIEDRQPMGNISEGLRVMQTVDAIYKSAKIGQMVKII
jgi:predicted dehydrogenase